MERYLKKDDTLQMNDGGKYVIAEMIGRGSSCAVYRAEHYTEGIQTEHLLKEYNPLLIDLWRLEDGSLHPSDADRNAFEVGMLRFRAGYEKQLSIRRISELRNSTSNVQAVFDANGTRYIDMTLFTGSTYSKVQEKSLHELCKRMKAVTQVIGYYHKAGFLHLDIKPDNIFTLPETCELVMLFDFDSVTEKTAVQSGSSLSCTKAWAAPEQIAPAQRKYICEATDLYAIGEMMFFRIFGRHSATEERRSFFEYQFDTEAPIFKNTDPKVFPLLSELLHHTVTTAVSNRYTSADELIAALDELIKLSDPKEPHLVSTRVVPEGFFIGRDHELQQIHEILTEENTLFLCGMGGIGKSELARNYVKQYRKHYDTVFFTTYMSSWMTLLTDDYNVQIANYHSYEGEKPEDYFARKLHKMKELCDERTLFVIDNVDEDEYDEIENECFRQIMELPCRFLFTSRLHEWNNPMLEIGVLSDHDDLVTLFDKWCHIKDDEQRSAVNEIIDYVDCHTLTLELIAKQTTAGFTTPAKMLAKLQEHGMHSSGKEKVKSDKDLTVTKKTAFEHICDLFDMAELTDGEKYVMANMALIPSMGVDAHLFMEWCEIEDADNINSLIAKGWVDRDEDMIKLHPIIREVAQQYGYAFDLGDTVMLKNAEKYLTEGYLAFSPLEKKRNADFSLAMSDVLIAANLRSVRVGSFLRNVPGRYSEYENLDRVIAVLRYALLILTEIHGEEHPDVASVVDYLGTVLLQKGDLQIAQQYCSRSLSIRKKLFGEKHPDVAESFNHLGRLNCERAKFDVAQQDLKCALDIYETLFGVEDSKVADSLQSLAECYFEIQDYDAAQLNFERVLTIRKKLFGEDFPAVADAYHDLGVTFAKKEEFDKAERCLEHSIRIEKKIFGEEHPDVAIMMNSYGMLCFEKKEYEKARQYCERSLLILRKYHGEEHPNVALLLNNLGRVYFDMGDFDLAIRYLNQALAIRKSILGEEHHHVAMTLVNMSLLFYKNGEPLKALNGLEQGVNIYRKVLGEEHPKTLETQKKIDEIHEILQQNN